MKTAPSIIAALVFVFVMAGSAMAMNHGKGPDLAPEKQAVVDKAHEEFAAATADLRKQIFAKESALNAEIYGEKIDEKKVEALVSEINALHAKVYAEQVKLRKKMAQEGIVPEPGHGKKSGMGCPMMGGGGMKHGMKGKMAQDNAAEGDASGQAPAAGGHDGH